jgi:hypothetical protein
VQHPDLVAGRLDVGLFADPLAREAFSALSTWPWPECLAEADPEVGALLQRLAVEELDGRGAPEELVVRVVVNLVEASSQRLLSSMLKRDDPRASEIKVLLDALANARATEHWSAAESDAEQLVTWITDDGDS